MTKYRTKLKQIMRLDELVKYIFDNKITDTEFRSQKNYVIRVNQVGEIAFYSLNEDDMDVFYHHLDDYFIVENA